jgi:hypothetical protein
MNTTMQRAERRRKKKVNQRKHQGKTTLKNWNDVFPKSFILPDDDQWPVTGAKDDFYSRTLDSYIRVLYPPEMLATPAIFHETALLAMVGWNLAVAEKGREGAAWGRIPFNNLIYCFRNRGPGVARRTIKDLLPAKYEHFPEDLFLVRNYEVRNWMGNLFLVVAAEEVRRGPGDTAIPDS